MTTIKSIVSTSTFNQLMNLRQHVVKVQHERTVKTRSRPIATPPGTS